MKYIESLRLVKKMWSLLAIAFGTIFYALSMSSSVQAQAVPEFECTPTGYLFQVPNVGDPTSAFAVNLGTGEYETIGSSFHPVASNAFGYNPADNFIYGMQDGMNGEVIRVGSDFTTEELGAPSNWGSYPFLSSRDFNAGTFDEEGHFWVMGGSPSGAPVTWAQIDLRPGSSTYMEILQAGTVGPFARTISDIVYNPLDGHLYTVADRTGGVPNFAFWRFNTDTLSIENAGPVIPGSVVSGPIVGAQFSDVDGFLYASSNTSGDIMRVDMTTGAAEFFTTGPRSNGNDGASCVLASLRTDYGDAPDSYGTLLQDNGPRHNVPDFDESTNTASLMLGANVSSESEGQPSPQADADTFDDGVTAPIALTPDEITNVDVVVTNNTDEVATLAGWIDTNSNGAFDAGERVTLEVPANSGADTYTLTFPGASALSADTYARFRLFPGVVADPQPVGVANAGEVEDYLVQMAGVRYQKSVSPLVAEIEPDQTFTYTVTVENTGASDLTGLTFTDTLTNVIDDATYNNDATADIGTATFNAPDEIAWSGDLAIGQTATIVYSVTMNSPVSGDGVLINSIVGDGPGSNCTDDPAIDPDCTTTVPLPDVSSQKTLVGPTNPQPGDVVNYQFVITNDGDSAITGLTAADDLAGVLDDAAYNNDASATSGSVIFNSGTERLNWSGSLAASGEPGDSVTITYSVTVNDVSNIGDGILRNALIAPGCPNSPIFDTENPDYNADCVTETPIEAWLATKSVTPSGAVSPNETLTYTVQVENVGGADLTGISFDDDLTNVLDDALYNNDAVASVGSVDYVTPTLTWNGDLNSGQSATITYSVTVNDADNLGDGILQNAITGPMNCPANECETETPVAAWTIQKTSTPAGPVQSGDTVEYSVVVENVGGVEIDASFSDTLTEVLDDAVYNNDLSATAGTPVYEEPTISWEGSLAAGQTATITYSVTVDEVSSDGDGILTNAVVAPAANCPTPAVTNPNDPNFNSNCVTITPVSEWIAIKSVTPTGTVSPGEIVTYNIVIENVGGADLTDLTVEDDLSDVLDDAAYNNDAVASTGSVSYSSPTLTWSGDLARGENAILSYSMTVNDSDSLGNGTLNNVLTGAPNCPSSDCETENPVEAWSASKTAIPNSAVNPGDTVEYIIEVVNEGATNLTNLNVEDDLSGVLDDATYNNDGNATIGSVSFSSPNLAWSGDLNVNESATITYSVTVNTANSLGDGMLNNTITGAPNCPSPDCETENPVQAWVARKAVTPTGGTNPGEVLTYTVTVENTGGADLTGADSPSVQDDLSDVLDDAAYNNDVSATIGSTSYTQPIIYWSGELLAGQSSSITYSVTVNEAGNLGDGLLNNVITGAPNCPDEVCETATRVANFEVEKSSNPEDGSNVTPGQDVTYTITIRNTGTFDLTDFEFEDNLSGVLNNAAFIGGPEVSPTSVGIASLSGTTLSFAGDIPEGEVVTVSYTVNVNNDAAAGVELRNVVLGEFSNCVTGGEPECITTHTVVDRDPAGIVASIEGLAETGRNLLPYILGATLLIAAGVGVLRWTPRRLR